MRWTNSLFWLFVGYDRCNHGVSFSLEVQHVFGVDICFHVKVLGLYCTVRSVLVEPKLATMAGNAITPHDVDDG